MPRLKRLELIGKLEEKLDPTGKAKVLCYLTGDRQGFETKIAFDVLPFLYEHLLTIGKTDTIALFLYSTGGLTMAGWRIVTLIREFCNKFIVLIPYKAHSCATLISLGANKIIMGPMGQLSPVDPTVTSPYNPPSPFQIPGSPPSVLPVSVEDVASFLDLAKTEVGLNDSKDLKEVFLKLANTVSPLALGSVHRARTQIRMLAKKLLQLHMKGRGSKNKIESIISMLTKELFSHDYIISRREAIDVLKLSVSEPDKELERLILNLFQTYSNDMQLNTVFNLSAFLGTENEKELSINRAFIESSYGNHTFRTRKIIKKRMLNLPLSPGQMPNQQEIIEERVLQEEWVRENFKENNTEEKVD